LRILFELNPKYVNAYVFRGIAYGRISDNDRAISDYSKAIELDPKDEYTRIWLLITLRKVSEERANRYLEEFRAYVNSNSSSLFIRTISNYYLGTNGLVEKVVLEEAKRGKDDRQIRGQMCEAYETSLAVEPAAAGFSG
jgi:lipoprotein NlpI